MRHGKQTAAFFLAAAMVMSSSPAVVFGEELESGAEQEAAVTETSTESELTSGEQESAEETGEVVSSEDNLLSAGSAQAESKKEKPQGKAESGITEIPIISEWQGTTEELWSWVYIEQDQKFTLDEAYAEVLKNHEIKWNWEPAEAKSESAVQLNPGVDGVSCTVTGVKGHAGEKGKLVVEVFDEAGKQTGSATSGQIEVREPSYKYDFPEVIYMFQDWEGKRALNMICVPEDADHPYGIEKIPVEIVDIKVDRPDLFEVQGWENGYVYLKSIGGDDSIFHSTTMTVAYKRLDNVLDTYSLSLMAYTWEYSGLLVSSSYTNRYAPTVKPGETVDVEALAWRTYIREDGTQTTEPFTDFYVEWILSGDENAVSIEQDKENSRLIYITAKEDTDGCKVHLKAHYMHQNEDGNIEEIGIPGGSPDIYVSIRKGPYRQLRESGDGKLYYYVDNKLDTEFEGVISYRSDAFYIKDGTVATDINGLHFVAEGYKEGTSEENVFSNTFCFFKDGQIDEDFEGLTEYDGAKFYVKDGEVVTDMNGLYLVSSTDDESTTDDKFYFFSNGQLQSEYKGLALYDNEWFYLENGYLDTNTNGIVEHDGGKFIVAVGRIAKEANGLWQDPKDGKWYFASNGQIQTQHTGVAGYDGKLFYVIKGELATDYKGTIKYNGAVYEVINGQLYKKK